MRSNVGMSEDVAKSYIGREVRYFADPHMKFSEVKSVRRLKEDFYVGELRDGRVYNIHCFRFKKDSN